MTDFSGATWRKSTRSGDDHGQCVELAILPGTVGIRDSKDPVGPVLVFGRREVAALIDKIKADGPA